MAYAGEIPVSAAQPMTRVPSWSSRTSQETNACMTLSIQPTLVRDFATSTQRSQRVDEDEDEDGDEIFIAGGDDAIQNPIVANCAADSQRMLRFAGVNTPAAGALSYVICDSSAGN
jgi:hypothetical protein